GLHRQRGTRAFTSSMEFIRSDIITTSLRPSYAIEVPRHYRHGEPAVDGRTPRLLVIVPRPHEERRRVLQIPAPRHARARRDGVRREIVALDDARPRTAV